MQNNQNFQQWAWNSEPWILVLLVILFLTIAKYVNWHTQQLKKAPARPVPRIVWVISLIGTAVGIFCGWYVQQDPRSAIGTIVSMLLLGFGGGMFGAGLGYCIHTPKIALRGAMIGVIIGAAFFIFEVFVWFRDGRDLWSHEAWKSRLVMFMASIFLFATIASIHKNVLPNPNIKQSPHP